MIQQYIGISPSTYVDWCNFIREVCVHYCLCNSPKKIGGPGSIVEIDEAKIGKRKYNRGRAIECQWIFGGTDRETKEVFLYPVKKRNKRTLLCLIVYCLARRLSQTVGVHMIP